MQSKVFLKLNELCRGLLAHWASTEKVFKASFDIFNEFLKKLSVILRDIVPCLVPNVLVTGPCLPVCQFWTPLVAPSTDIQSYRVLFLPWCLTSMSLRCDVSQKCNFHCIFPFSLPSTWTPQIVQLLQSFAQTAKVALTHTLSHRVWPG